MTSASIPPKKPPRQFHYTCVEVCCLNYFTRKKIDIEYAHFLFASMSKIRKSNKSFFDFQKTNESKTNFRIENIFFFGCRATMPFFDCNQLIDNFWFVVAKIQCAN